MPHICVCLEEAISLLAGIHLMMHHQLTGGTVSVPNLETVLRSSS